FTMSPLPPFGDCHPERMNGLGDMRPVSELGSLAYDLNGFRLTENADGKFHRLRKGGIHVVRESGRSSLRRNEGLKSLGYGQTAKPLESGYGRRMAQNSNE